MNRYRSNPVVKLLFLYIYPLILIKMIEDFKVWMVIFNEVKRTHYKITWRFLQQKSWLKYLACKQRQPVKKCWSWKTTIFTERDIEAEHIKISEREFD